MEEPQNIVFDLINQAEKYGDHQIDTITVNAEPWFKGRDVANLLGYKNVHKAMIDNIDDDDKLKLEILILRTSWTLTLTYNQKNTIYITESGLYSLIMKSKLPLARAFKKWVKDLIPKIRRQGEANYMQKLEESNMKMDLIEKQNQEQRAAIALQIAALEKSNIEFARRHVHYKSFVDNKKLLEKTQVFYIATTRGLSLQNRFKIGGLKNSSEIKSRLATYNSGHAEDDPMYFCKLYKCHKYRDVEERIGSILAQFKDKLESRKEMMHMRFEHLVEVVEFLCDNYDQEIDFINNFLKKYLIGDIETEIVISSPPPIDKFENVNNISTKKPAKVEKIDISELNTEELHALIESIINRCAKEQLKQNYDFATQKHIVDLELTWKLVGAYLDLYNRFNRKGWRQQFKDWFLEIKPRKLQIKGIELKL